MLKDFQNFLMKGNVIDLAVAVIIGAAFKPIITALVDKIIMPPIGMAMGGVSFGDLKYVIQKAVPAKEDVAEVAEVAIGYGAFIQSVIDFVIIGLCVFVMIKVFENMQKKEEEAPKEDPKPSEDIVLLTEIRDLMKKK